MIITIGRQCGCGADEIGKMLSEKYAMPMVYVFHPVSMAIEELAVTLVVITIFVIIMIFIMFTKFGKYYKDYYK